MHILVTGANGFLGKALVRQILADDFLQKRGKSLTRLTLFGRRIDKLDDPRVTVVEGDIRDPAARARALEGKPDDIYHLAGVLIAQSEPDFALGRSVNLDAAIDLADEAAAMSPKTRFVFTSTIGVYGSPLPPVVDDDTLVRPNLSYGTHKLMCETYLSDLARRGDLDVRTVRVPGTLPRPRLPDRAFSPAFSSNIFHALSAGEPYDCPVSPDASLWGLSLQACIDNLLHAGNLAPEAITGRRVWMLPALRLTMGELFEALVARFGEDRRALMAWNPILDLEERLGRLPLLKTPAADAAGFRHDGDIDTLVSRVCAVLSTLKP